MRLGDVQVAGDGFGPLRSPALLVGIELCGEVERSSDAEVALDVHRRIQHAGMLVVALGKQNGCANVDRAAPEAAEQGTLKLDPLHPWRVGRHFDGWDLFREFQFNPVALARIQMDLANLAEQVSGRACEILALPLVHVSPDYVAVAPREFGVD